MQTDAMCSRVPYDELVVGRHVDRRGVVQSVGGGGSAEWGGAG
jgi:hypothetical protein